MLAVLALALWSAPAEDRVELSSPIPAVAVVLAPGQSTVRSDTSSILAAFSRALEPHTDLRVASPEQVGLDVARLLECPPEARMGCWAKQLGALGGAPPRYLFVLSVFRRDGDSPLLSALVLDVEAALALSGTAEQIEAAIYDASARTVPIALVDEDATCERLAQVELKPVLERAGRWRRLGRLRLTMPCEDCTVELDGQPLATPTSGVLMVERIPSGKHTVSVRRASEVRWSELIDVGAGLERTIALDADSVALDRPSHAALPWMGGGASAVGVAVGAIGLASIAGRAPFACVARSAADEGRCVDPASDGALLTTIGTGLVLAGASWLSLSFIERVDEWPEWAPMALGAALGAAGATVAAVASP